MTFHLLFILTAVVLCALVHAEDRVLDRMMLRMENISRQEEILKKATDEKSKRTAEAMITVLFREMKADFDPKDLDNYTLVRVGDYLRIHTATPREALLYYDEVLGREDPSYRHHALMGRAQVYGLSPRAADMDKAIEAYTEIYEKSEERSARELALLRKIEVLMKKQEYAGAGEWAQVYLDRDKTSFTKYSAKVGLLLAESYDKQNRKDEAITSYVKVWAVHMGYIQVSAPALTRWMELLCERNQPAAGNDRSDRQSAYEQGAKYIELTSRFKDKLTKEELELWQGVEKLVKTYEASPEIKAGARKRKK